jgi:hypothetical protein
LNSISSNFQVTRPVTDPAGPGQARGDRSAPGPRPCPHQAAPRIISRAQQDGDLPPRLDATALATILVAATDGLKDLSDILDPPNRAKRGFEQRMQRMTEIVEALISRNDHPARG